MGKTYTHYYAKNDQYSARDLHFSPVPETRTWDYVEAFLDGYYTDPDVLLSNSIAAVLDGMDGCDLYVLEHYFPDIKGMDLKELEIYMNELNESLYNRAEADYKFALECGRILIQWKHTPEKQEQL